MATRIPKGKEIERLEPTTRKQGEGYTILRPVLLRGAGFESLGGKARRFRAPDGRILSRRAAYREIGLPLMTAKDWKKREALEGQAAYDFLRRKGFKDFRRAAEFY